MEINVAFSLHMTCRLGKVLTMSLVKPEYEFLKNALFSVNDIFCFSPSGLVGGLFSNSSLCRVLGPPLFVHSTGIYRVLVTLGPEPSAWVAVAKKPRALLWPLLAFGGKWEFNKQI